MLRRVATILVVSVLLVAFLAVTAFTAQTKNSGIKLSRQNKAAYKALGYSFAEEKRDGLPATGKKGHITLGEVSYSTSSASPGQTVGATYYDYQHNCSMGRMIETGPHSGQTGATTVHFSWMHMADPDDMGQARSYAYNAYNSSTHQYAGAYILHDEEYSGYVNLDVTPDNRGIVGGHTDVHGPVKYQGQFHFDACSGCEDFSAFSRIPDSLAAYDQEGDVEAMWPKFLFQFGTDTVLHMITHNWDYYGAQMYIRCVGYEGEGQWEYPPYVVDTNQCMAHDLTGPRVGNKVGLAWLASPPYEEPSCDTCSGYSPYDGLLAGQYDNDVYLQVSNDQGVSWEPRRNITQLGIGEPGYRAYCDLSILFDTEGYLHVVWNGVPWPSDTSLAADASGFTEDWWLDPARLFHWSENLPYVRTVHDATWHPSDSCAPPNYWTVNVAKMSLSECNGRMYCLFTQFNDVPHGVIDDCAQWGYDEGRWRGPANGDLWMCISADGGMTWDAPRNLTNSYTPHCDPIAGEDCQSDYWASMTRWGRQVQSGEDWAVAEIVDPSGGTSPTDYYLDVQYVNDLDAGAIIWGDPDAEGSWTFSPIKWFRVPCVEEVSMCNPVFSINQIDDPAWTKPGVQRDTSILVENIGNADYTFSVSTEEDNGSTGWLGVGSYSGTIPSGLGNTETIDIYLNNGGVQTEQTELIGRIIFTGNHPDSPHIIPVNFFVVDTMIWPAFDSVHTNCLALICGSNGNFGREGSAGVTMDYIRSGDCDAEATNYIYDGSPLVGWVDGTDTVFNYAVWGAYFTSDDCFRPQGGHINTVECLALNAEVFHSGVFSTQDSTIALEKVTVAPLDDCPFIIQYLRVYSFDGLAHTGLMIGEAIDWDIPYDWRDDDTAAQTWDVCNYGGMDVGRSLLYQQGYEATWDDQVEGEDCQDNTARYGGSAFVQSFFNGAFAAGGPYGGFIGENDSLQTATGFYAGRLYYDLAQSGLTATDSIEDLHSAMCFNPSLDLGATDYYEVVTVLATVHEGTLADLQANIDAGKAWYTANGGIAMFADVDRIGGIDLCQGCCEIMGDLNGDDYLDPLDITYFVNWLWKGGPDPDCEDEVDVNGDLAGDPLDLTYLVNYIWKGGPAPVPCH